MDEDWRGVDEVPLLLLPPVDIDAMGGVLEGAESSEPRERLLGLRDCGGR